MDFAFSENGKHGTQFWDLKSPMIQASFLVYPPIHLKKEERRRRRKGIIIKKKKRRTHKKDCLWGGEGMSLMT